MTTTLPEITTVEGIEALNFLLSYTDQPSLFINLKVTGQNQRVSYHLLLNRETQEKLQANPVTLPEADDIDRWLRADLGTHLIENGARFHDPKPGKAAAEAFNIATGLLLARMHSPEGSISDPACGTPAVQHFDDDGKLFGASHYRDGVKTGEDIFSGPEFEALAVRLP